ncbi:GNAT family N-acetyltransferase [Rhodoplanes roseus]|uniref:BioF2-like acetyltransferase domain-containing protein n=1 Tax=Rhodoplanes roseus TaxID=29409 RepID=A0A327KFN7_9BRAD|nr:GNAT family N-acetyltransferase [Rhodoplanes roseus]RAI37620.1 hypothetical protein CH341_29325 [Rhodoplanes roseus]
MSTPETAVLHEREAVAALVPDWWELFGRSDRATPFQSPAWQLAWWDAFSPGLLRVAAVRSAGRLVGLAPFYREHGTDRLLPIGISASDYLDVLVDPAVPAAGDRIVAALADDAWTEWELTDLLPDAAALDLPVPAGCTEERSDAAPCPVIALPDAPDDLADRLPKRKRRSIGMDRNRARRRGDVRTIAARDGAEGLRLLAELIRMHQARWTARGEPGVFADERIETFHATALPQLLGAGLARLDAMTIDGTVAAVLYQLADERRRYAYLAGFDAAFAHESPGTLLLAEAMETAVRAGAREYHLLRGDEAYKFGWGAVVRHTRRRVFRRPER